MSQSGWTISRDCGCIVDVVIVLENSVLLAGELACEISNPLRCHFVRSELLDDWMGDYDCREGFPTAPASRYVSLRKRITGKSRTVSRSRRSRRDSACPVPSNNCAPSLRGAGSCSRLMRWQV